MSMLRLRVEGQRLRSFTLREVPENIRRKHGERLVTLAYKDAVKRGVRGYELLGVGLDAKRAIVRPSPVVYRVSQDAWDAMMAESEKLARRERRSVAGTTGRRHVLAPGATEFEAVA